MLLDQACSVECGAPCRCDLVYEVLHAVFKNHLGPHLFLKTELHFNQLLKKKNHDVIMM